MYARICATERKIPEGAAPVRAKTFPPRYYLIRALMRAYESTELYYKPESYTRALPSLGIDTYAAYLASAHYLQRTRPAGFNVTG
jgi:hypothetical protein